MSPALPSSLPEPLRVAHRGAAGHAPPSSAEAFRLALRLGATAVGGEVWATADHRAVLRADDGVGRLRRRRVRQVARDELGPAVVDVAQLYDLVGPTVPLLVDVADPDAVADVVAAADRVGARPSVWLCSADLDALAEWGAAHPGVRLVWSAGLRHLPAGPERAAARLREVGVDALRLHHAEWTGGLTTLVHRFGRLAFAADVVHTRVAVALLRMGVDALWSAYPDRLADAAGWQPSGGSDAAGA